MGETSKKNRGNGAGSFVLEEDKKKGQRPDFNNEAMAGFDPLVVKLHFARLFSPSFGAHRAGCTYRIPKILLCNHPSCQNHARGGLPETLALTVMRSKSEGPKPHTYWFLSEHCSVVPPTDLSLPSLYRQETSPLLIVIDLLGS